MKTGLYNKYNLLMTILMSVFTMAKIQYLYTSTLAPDNSKIAFLRTLLLIAVLYTTLNYILFKKSFILRLALHELIAIIILADIMFFKYFDSLPSVSELGMLDTLPDIWTSITDLFEPEFILLFADTLILGILHFILKKNAISLPVGAIAPILAFSWAVILLMDSLIFGIGNSYQVFDSFGLVHFHIKQTWEALADKNIQNAGDASLKSLKDLAAPKQEKPKYFNTANSKNLIVVQVEALQNFVINRHYEGQELTPNLNKLIEKDSIYFDRYYQNTGRGNTADAEFAAQHSLYPALKVPSYKKYQDKELYGLPKILKAKGYSTLAFHGYIPSFWNRDVMYPLMGFDKFVSKEGFVQDEVIGWGVSDSTFFRQSVQYLKQTPKPFYGFMVTLTSHHPFDIPEKYNKIKLKDVHKNTLLGNYLNTIHYVDYSLGVLIESLKKNGLYDDTIIAIYGDHQGIFYKDEESQKLMTELLGHGYTADVMANVPLIMHIPNAGINDTISTPGGHLDFMPTIMNLMGIEDEKAIFYGQDLCNNVEGFATIQLFLPKGSFIDNERVYIASSDGIFENGSAWDFNTKQPIALELCRTGYDRAMKELDECDYLITNNLLNKQLTGKKPSQNTDDSSFLIEFKHPALSLFNLASD